MFYVSLSLSKTDTCRSLSPEFTEGSKTDICRRLKFVKGSEWIINL